MSVVDDLLQALSIPELQLFVTGVPADDSQFAHDLTTLLGHAYGSSADADLAVQSRTRDLMAQLVKDIGPAFGAGANPVTSAILADDPGATYGALVKSTVQAQGGLQVRPGVVATEGAAEILADLAAAGIEWGQPDETMPGQPFAPSSGQSPATGTTTQTPAAAARATETDAVLMPLGVVPTPQVWLDEVRKIVKEVGDAVGDGGIASNRDLGKEVHLILQAQFAEWAHQQAPLHRVVVDNKVPNPLMPVPWPQDLPGAKTWFRHATWLSDITDGSVEHARFEQVIDALGTGRKSEHAYRWPKPDILDNETHRLWEIKSVGEAEKGIEDILYYLYLLNLQVAGDAATKAVLSTMAYGTPTIDVSEGFWLPGRPWVPWPFLFALFDGRGAIAFPAGPGLMLYQVITKELFVPLQVLVATGALFMAMQMFYLRLLKQQFTPAAAREAVLAALSATLNALAVAARVALIVLTLAGLFLLSLVVD